MGHKFKPRTLRPLRPNIVTVRPLHLFSYKKHISKLDSQERGIQIYFY